MMNHVSHRYKQPLLGTTIAVAVHRVGKLKVNNEETGKARMAIESEQGCD
jgi:hypothetical protein